MILVRFLGSPFRRVAVYCWNCGQKNELAYQRCVNCGSTALVAPLAHAHAELRSSLPAGPLTRRGTADVRALLPFEFPRRKPTRIHSVRDLRHTLGVRRKPRLEISPAVVWGSAVAAAVLLTVLIVVMAMAAHSPG